MASAGSTQQSFRKALGALKDSTLVGLAKVNSDYKVISIAISVNPFPLQRFIPNIIWFPNNTNLDFPGTGYCVGQGHQS